MSQEEVITETPTLQEVARTLESVKELKSGISGSRIKRLTAIALENIELEEEIISLIINYSKTCEPSHKLGSLYIIDSVGRAYLDEARNKHGYIKPNAKPGTCAHGVYTLGESIQELLTDAIGKSNEDHKDKIRTLIDIWDRTGLFQKGYLNAVRAKCFSMEATGLSSLTKSDGGENSEPQLSSDPVERAGQILKSLNPVQYLPAVEMPTNLCSEDQSEQNDALRKLLVSLQRDLLTRAEQQQEQQRRELEQHKENSRRHSDIKNNNPQREKQHRVTEYGSRRDRERQTAGYASRRNRSRSPPARKEVTTYNNGAINQNFGPNNHHLYPEEMNVPQNPHFRTKPLSYDPSLPPESIKVLSRTLFIGGVPMNMKEWDLASLLKPYAEVQSVILNNHRKHAFVKVYSRREAENALMNFNQDGSLPLRTRWGVGFGPRDCCDYQHGYSIIPIHRLTDADRKWSVEAQWGGTGGQPLVAHMVYEEPDIIVGEGVSSKATSQKMPTDSGRNAPKSNKNQRDNYQQQRQAPIQPPQPQPQMAGYNGSNQMYPQMQPPIQGYPPKNDMYAQQMGGYGVVAPQQQGNIIPPPQQQQQPGVDPQAQLNSLMSMLNQQPPAQH
ncbi:Nrd1 complex RNA-binding subunit KNAG_0F00640 [Huiozyma naganishii CBS 8797]|uniref:CID domain-containing protein n=1 Tax=Huiozyma naganishii (strain ATCC MYA-139 / BCRC 22969 / CBS 8797 / KCTC 17520 / NBRC 10181 / NCYC 3082 / Yp74L-3) TaxID=1071383 RepID=J7RMF4_HUIN7|nr:hypothetical protein KNAG_0F00640 [Kazachstania naganishii CBS 8797]CCK70733.1 hypothetical protein KNAG_0F00640 [Kazachstania naganishii CBS 8797]